MKRFLSLFLIISMLFSSLLILASCGGTDDGEFSAEYVEIEPTEEAINPILEEIALAIPDYSAFGNYSVTYNYESKNDAGELTARYVVNMNVDADAELNGVFAIINAECYKPAIGMEDLFRICIYRMDEGTSFYDYRFCVQQASRDFDGTYFDEGGRSGTAGQWLHVAADADPTTPITELIYPTLGTEGYNSYLKNLFRSVSEEFEVELDYLNNPATEVVDHSANIGSFVQSLGHLRYVATKSYKAYRADGGFYKLVWDGGAVSYLKINEDGTYHYKAIGATSTQELTPINEELESPSYRAIFRGSGK